MLGESPCPAKCKIPYNLCQSDLAKKKKKSFPNPNLAILMVLSRKARPCSYEPLGFEYQQDYHHTSVCPPPLLLSLYPKLQSLNEIGGESPSPRPQGD